MNQTDLLNHLLIQQPEEVYKWLQKAISGLLQVPEDFNWLGLAEGVVSTAEATADNGPDSLAQALQWAKIGVTTYEYMLNRHSGRYSRSSLENSLMWLRAFFIIRLGPVEHDSLLGAEQIIQWFFQDLPYSRQELAELIEVWQGIKKQPSLLQQLSHVKEIAVGQRILKAEDLQKMRIVKNKLKVVKVLFENKCFSPTQDEELHHWIALWDRLP